VIRTFANAETERAFRRLASRRLSAEVQRVVYRKLVVIDAAESLNDLRIPPGNRLEKLKGNREGQHRIRVNERWRICFRWKEGDACEVEIADYHR
jgi:proteic killer suppression protein